MNSVVAPLAEGPAWSALWAHEPAIGALAVRKLFVDDPAGQMVCAGVAEHPRRQGT
jgi:hypothetical protein